MKIRVADRLLVAIAGLLILAICAGVVCQSFFGVDLISKAERVFNSDSLRVKVALVCLAVLLFLLGCYCVLVLFRHRKRKDKFILQKNDNGELSISLKALSGMVQKCLDQHDEIKVQNLHLENKKDGVLIRIRGAVAGGISIPLTVEALQKQIKQYVTACSGVEVKGVQVQIESSGKDAENAPFAIAAPAAKPLLKESQTDVKQTEETSEPEVKTDPVEVAHAAEPAIATVQETKPVAVPDVELDDDDNDERPLHQRLFSSTNQPCIVPEPPVVSEPAQKETVNEDSAENEDSVETEQTDEIVRDAEETNEDVTEQPAVDEEFLDSLKAFDQVVTGNQEEEEE